MDSPRGNEHGIRFTFIHKSQQQRFTFIYALKSGPTIINYPAKIDSIKITASRRFEYVSTTSEISLKDQSDIVMISIKRSSSLRNSRLAAIEKHLHYDRLSSADDRLWLAMRDADGLDAGRYIIERNWLVPGQ